MKYSNSEVKKLGTILGVWAHPDDEAFSCAGLLSAALNNGQRVVLITATYGDAGSSADDSRWPTKNLGTIRKNELEKCLKLMGSVEHHWLGHADGKLDSLNHNDVVEVLISYIKKIKPNTVITFEPGGITGHDDHKTVYRWTKDVLNKFSVQSELFCVCENHESYEKYGKQLDSKYNVYFNCKCPRLVSQKDADICFVLDDKTLSKKVQCIKAHASQTEHMFKKLDSAKLVSEMARVECYIKDI